MTKRLESDENGVGLYRIVLEPRGEGVYAFIYETADSAFPERDYLLDTMEGAVAMCVEEYGVPAISWRVSDQKPMMNPRRSRS